MKMPQKSSTKFIPDASIVSLKKVEYIPVDRKIWNSIKRRIAVIEKVFDPKDIIMVLVG